MFEWFQSTKSSFGEKDFYKIFIDYPRPKLLERIQTRTEKMIEKGVVLEVKNFIRLNTSSNKTSFKAIGIKEVGDYLNKKIELDSVIEKISIKTRQYAKRQTTWGRGHMSDWNKIKSNGLNQFLKKI